MADLIVQEVINGISIGSIYVMIAVGLTLIFGILDVTNFAHGEFYMLGAYAAYLVVIHFGVPYAVGILVSLLVGAALGLAVERTVFRPIQFTPPINGIIASLGLSILLANVALVVLSPTPVALEPAFTGSFSLAGFVVSKQELLVLTLALALVFALTLFVDRTWTGLGMRAMTQDVVAARLVGISPTRISQVTFLIGGALAAVAGGLVAPIFVLQPSMGLPITIKAFAVVIFAGVGSVRGTIIAGLILGIAESLTAGFVGVGYEDLISFGVIILVLLVRPRGIWGTKGFLGRAA